MARIIVTDPFAELGEIPDDCQVITPNRASAERLSRPYRSLTHVARDVLRRAGVGVASPLISWHALRAAAAASFNRPCDPSAEAVRLREMVATILRNGIDTNELRKHGSARVGELASVTDRYVDMLAKKGLVDENAVLRKAAELGPPPQKLFVYGYFRGSAHDIEFIDEIAAEGSFLCLPCGEEPIFASTQRSIMWLRSRGWDVDAKVNSPAFAGSDSARRFAEMPVSAEAADGVTAYSFPDIESEVRGAMAAAKRLINSGVNAGEIAILCRRADDYSADIAAVSREYGLPVEIRSKRPLGDTAFGQFVRLVLEAAGNDLAFEVTARLLNHRCGPQMSPEAWAEARRTRASGPEEWTAAGVDVGWLEPDGEPRSFDDWAEWLRSVLGRADAKQAIQADAAEMTAFNLFDDSIGEIAEIEGGRALEFETFAALVSDVLRNVVTRFAPSSGGIAFHQPDSMIGGRFAHVFALGMAEGMLPAETKENSVVDFYERKQLAEHDIIFDDAAEYFRWEALSFYFVLLTATGSIRLSYPMSIDQQPQIKSSYFEKLGLEPSQHAELIASSPREARRLYLRSDEYADDGGVLDAARRQWAVEWRRESAEAFDEFDGAIGQAAPLPERWSVSQLTTLGQCPFKWFAQRILRLSPAVEGDTDLRNDVLGNLYHRTLEIASRGALGSTNFREQVQEKLEASFSEAESDEKISVQQLPNWDVRRLEHLEVLRRAVAAEGFITPSARAVAIEQEFIGDWEGFPVRGYIDRIDESEDGLMAVDYKTGTYISKAKDDSGELKIDLQLPIYSSTGVPCLFPGKAVAGGRYYSLRQKKDLPAKDANLDGFVRTTKEILAAGTLHVDPDGKQKVCDYCDYDPLCRRGLRQSRKGAAE